MATNTALKTGIQDSLNNHPVSRTLDLDQIGIGELLDQEEDPAFIIDIGDRSNYADETLRLLFCNKSLKQRSDLLDLLQGDHKSLRHSDETVSSYTGFKAWITSFVEDFNALKISLPPYSYGGIIWICSATLRKRLRIFKGQIEGSQRSNHANAKAAGSKNQYRGKSPVKLTTSDLVFAHDSKIGLVSKYRAQDLELDASRQDRAISTAHVTDAWAERQSSKENTPAHQISDSQDTGLSQHLTNEAILSAATAGNVDTFGRGLSTLQSEGFFDWTRLPFSTSLPRHIQFARNVEWSKTSLGPIENWPAGLREMCNLIMASPHPAAMYWGKDLTAIYNESYIMLAGQKHPSLMGTSYKDAWSEIWDGVKDVFASAISNAQATMKDDDQLFIRRGGFLEETYFSWSIIPLIGQDGSVVGLYNPAFEKTRRKIAERRMLTLREIGQTTAAARDISEFWSQVLKGLEYNEYDAPFVLVYSIADDSDSSEVSSITSGSQLLARQCVFQGSLGIPEDHPAAPTMVDLKYGDSGFAAGFRQAIRTDRPILLQETDGTLDPHMLDDLSWRGFGDRCRSCIVVPIHPTTGESTLGFLIMGLNPRRPYDEDYSLFVQLLSRQLATSVASVVLYEEEIKRNERAARLAAQDRIELSNQLAARTQEAVDLEIRFTRMAELAPVGMFIADSSGNMTFCNQTWYDLSRYPKGEAVSGDWMEYVHEVDRPALVRSWSKLIDQRMTVSLEFRFKTSWQDTKGNFGDTWALMSAYPETSPDGRLQSVFGSVTDISSQKFAEDLNKKRMEEAVELKRQQQNYIDTTSHEIRNPLSAITMCSEEVTSTLEEVKASSDLSEHILTSIESALDAAQTITLCAQHQKRIVDDVLTLSKLDSAMLMVTPVDVQPVTVAQRALKMFEGELQNGDIDLDFKVEESFTDLNIDWVRLDPSRLLQILINLVTNAIKFTKGQEQRHISVQLAANIHRPSESSENRISYVPTRSTGKDITVNADWGTGEKIYLYFAVTDTGRGLTESEKKLLFLRFSQGSPRTHVAYGGSGLGLFISRELVEMQGGEIGVSSQSGKGSTFAFYILAKRSHAPKDWAETHSSSSHIISRKGSGTRMLRNFSRSHPDEPAKQSNLFTGERSTSATTTPTALITSPPASPAPTEDAVLRIFIVEDNLVNQKVLAKQLTKIGCSIQVANHGGEALERLRTSRYWKGHEQDGEDLGLILMDIEMPVMDGLTAARKIRELERNGLLTVHVPIMAVTANAREEQITLALDAGMDGVVSKPFRVPDLLPKMKTLMERSRSARP